MPPIENEARKMQDQRPLNGYEQTPFNFTNFNSATVQSNDGQGTLKKLMNKLR